MIRIRTLVFEGRGPAAVQAAAQVMASAMLPRRTKARRPQGRMPQRGKKKFSAETEAKIVEAYAKLPARDVGKVLGIAISHQGVIDIVRRHGAAVRSNVRRKKEIAG